MKRLIILFILLFPISFQGVDLLAKQKQNLSPPNPSDLTITWWDYYKVDSKDLELRKKQTQTYFQNLTQTLPYEERLKAQPYFDRILNGLTVLIELKSQTPAQFSTPPSILDKKIPFQEWVNLSNTVLEKKEELEYFELKLDLSRSSYQSAENRIDHRFSHYLKMNNTDPKRLLEGLMIIQGRIFIAIEKIQISNLESFVEEKKANITALQEQIEKSYRNIDLNTISIETIENQLTEAEARQKQANNQYILSYENFSSLFLKKIEKEKLLDQQILNNKLDYEISRVDLVNLEIQMMIASWLKKKQSISGKVFRNQIENWEKITSDIQKGVLSSENNSELFLQQALKNLALQKGNYLTDQTLESSEKAILKIEQLKNSLYANHFLLDQLVKIKQELHFDPIDRFFTFWQNLYSLIKSNISWLNKTLFKVGEFPVTFFGIIQFILIIIIAYIIGKLSKNLINHFGRKQNRIKITSIYILGRVSNYLILFFGLIFAGYAIGLDLTIFAYIAGALAIWVGFSLQSIFHNFISGIIVLLTKTIRIHDVIELESGEIGVVSDMNLRTTVIRSVDGKDIVIPNADLVTKKFINYTLSSHTIRIRIPFRIALTEDKERVSQIVVEAAKAVEVTSSTAEPELWITGYGENYMNVELVVWINTAIKAKVASRESLYYFAIDDALKKNGISIPIPLRDIQIKK